MENNNNDFTDFRSTDYDYGSINVDLNDDKTYLIYVGSQGKCTENVQQNVDDDSSNDESDDDGSVGDYSADDEDEYDEIAGDEGEDDESEGDKNLDDDDDIVVGEEMVRINSLTADGIRAM